MFSRAETPFRNWISVHIPVAPGFALHSTVEANEKNRNSRHHRLSCYKFYSAALLVYFLEDTGINGYTVSEPTIIELFLKMTADNTALFKDGQDCCMSLQKKNSFVNLPMMRMHW